MTAVISPDAYRRGSARRTPEASFTPGSAAMEAFWGLPTNGLPHVSESTVNSVTTVYACVNLVAGAISTLLMKIYRREADGERAELPDDALWWTLNEEMCPRWSAANGWEFLVMSLLLQGNGFAIIRRRGAVPVGLIPVHPDRVQVFVAPGGERLVYAISPDPAEILTDPQPERRVYDQDDIIHISGLGFGGVMAPSPLRRHLRNAVGVAIATQDYAGQFFANGARPDYVLHTDSRPSPEAVERIRESINENHAGPHNARKPMLLTDGIKFQSVTMPMEDVEMLGLRKFQVEEITRCFGVQPWMIGHEQKMALGGSGAEAIGTQFVRFTLAPHLSKIAGELNRKLFRTARKFVEFDTFSLERADMRSLFESFRIAVGRAGEPGFLSVDEVRGMINYGRTPGGDQLASGVVAPAAEEVDA